MEIERIGRNIIDKIPIKYRSRFFHLFESHYLSYKKKKLYGNIDMPISVDVEISSACNRSCPYCPRVDTNTRLTTKMFNSIVDQLSDMGFKGRFTPSVYNEPLLDKRLYGLLRYAKSKLKDSKILIYTNGDFLTEEKVETLEKIGVSEIRATIHIPTTVIQANKLKSIKNPILNITDYRDLKNVFWNRGGLINLHNETKLKRCSIVDSLIIRSNGLVALCCNDIHFNYVLGDIYKEPLSEIWKMYGQLRKNIRKGEFNLSICQRCKFGTYHG